MANHQSALKRIRQNAKRAARNRGNLSRIRTFLRKFEEAIASRKKEAIGVAFRQAQAEVQKGVRKGVLHANTASRKISRLNYRVKALDSHS
ncbi:MAG: 30S ribosomal protein S20 [Holosporales bacterium]|jgi:small subunit ribosomal protein S20|nr:30S ribosomal protein S20 [Holosporales bacterium]